MNGKVELSIKVQSNDAPKLVIVEMSKVKEEKNQNSSMLEGEFMNLNISFVQFDKVSLYIVITECMYLASSITLGDHK